MPHALPFGCRMRLVLIPSRSLLQAMQCRQNKHQLFLCGTWDHMLTVRHNDCPGIGLPWVVVSTILCGNLDKRYHNENIVPSGAVKSSRWIPLGTVNIEKDIRLTSVRSYLYKRSPDISQCNPLSIAILSIASFGLSRFCPNSAT